ncbi:hypothetical protein L3i20_v218540 [Paenibacillus sp. L3-i20]|nr:hypothetical protein L3i20_v218540 [Paenibacillus sp. L3-i20]
MLHSEDRKDRSSLLKRRGSLSIGNLTILLRIMVVYYKFQKKKVNFSLTIKVT